MPCGNYGEKCQEFPNVKPFVPAGVDLFFLLLARKGKPNTPQFQQKRLRKEPVLQVDRSHAYD